MCQLADAKGRRFSHYVRRAREGREDVVGGVAQEVGHGAQAARSQRPRPRRLVITAAPRRSALHWPAPAQAQLRCIRAAVAGRLSAFVLRATRACAGP